MSKKQARTQSAKVASLKARADARERRKSPVFTYRKWTIVRFDALNMKLIHENDEPHIVRYYSTLGGAMYGLRKEIGYASPDLNAAIESWDELATKITALSL